MGGAGAKTVSVEIIPPGAPLRRGGVFPPGAPQAGGAVRRRANMARRDVGPRKELVPSPHISPLVAFRKKGAA